MLQAFRNTNFRRDSLDRINKINDVLEEYGDQKLTARQVYYQFVARGWLDNNVKNYKNLTSLLTDARYAGMVSWNAIEDRGREPSTPSEWRNIGELVETALHAYRLPRWRGQEHYVELWVEKQALAGVLQPIARKYHVTLMVNKGYSSASAMKESADRMIRCSEGDEREGDAQKNVSLFYLGDHDPSGEDMVRDIRDRLREFGVPCLDVYKIALTMEQIKKWNPPPNPAKLTDSRAAAYIDKFGDQSWELDALPPRELNRLIEAAFQEVVDVKMMNAIVAQEDKDKERLRVAASKIAKSKS